MVEKHCCFHLLDHGDVFAEPNILDFVKGMPKKKAGSRESLKPNDTSGISNAGQTRWQ